jgi:hypothetical protein
MKVRQHVGHRDGRRTSARAAWVSLLIVAVAGFGSSTCGSLDRVLVTCSDSGDCQEHPGTVCTDEMCVCDGLDVVFCDGVCKRAAECEHGAGGGGTDGGTARCITAADCEQPGDFRCGEATCTDGVCGLELRPLSPLASQLKGDCKYAWCDGQGNRVEFLESTDFYNDGAQCIVNSCQGDMPSSLFVADGTTCPETGTGVCYQGQCVECIDDKVACGGNLVCYGVLCVPNHCVNNQWDPGAGEMAKDCGGSCQACDTGNPCKVSTDCIHKVCANGSCKGPTCSDGVQNDSETGIDCGGPPTCPRCLSGEGCKLPSDCLSGVCWAGVCEAPSCTDGMMNGDEDSEDCGGPCTPCH